MSRVCMDAVTPCICARAWPAPSAQIVKSVYEWKDVGKIVMGEQRRRQAYPGKEDGIIINTD